MSKIHVRHTQWSEDQLYPRGARRRVQDTQDRHSQERAEARLVPGHQPYVAVLLLPHRPSSTTMTADEKDGDSIGYLRGGRADFTSQGPWYGSHRRQPGPSIAITSSSMDRGAWAELLLV